MALSKSSFDGGTTPSAAAASCMPGCVAAKAISRSRNSFRTTPLRGHQCSQASHRFFAAGFRSLTIGFQSSALHSSKPASSIAAFTSLSFRAAFSSVCRASGDRSFHPIPISFSASAPTFGNGGVVKAMRDAIMSSLALSWRFLQSLCRVSSGGTSVTMA